LNALVLIGVLNCYSFGDNTLKVQKL